MDKYDTKLSSWYIVQFIDEDTKNIDFEVLWGIIEVDHKGRFDRGHYVATSKIVKIVDDEYVHTSNSIYKIEKDCGETITLPARHSVLFALRYGIPPFLLRDDIELH